MKHMTTRRALAVALPILAAGLPPATAAAAPASFTCAASVVTARALDGAPQAPIRAGADGTACRRGASGLQDAGSVLSIGSGIQARTAYAAVDPGGERPASSSPSAKAGVEGLSLAAAGLPLSVDAARSGLSARCAGGRPVFTPASRVASIRLGNTALVVDGVVQPVTSRLSDALGGVASVRLNEVVDLPGGGKAVRAAHVRVAAGGRVLADVVIAESRLDLAGAACDPVAGGGGDEDQPPTVRVCPDGSVLDSGRSRCVIAVPGSQTDAKPVGDLTGKGSVVVGRPGSGPSGGTVITLAQARKRFPKSRCVKGSGPRYVVVGSKRGDRITGTNRPDRLLGRRGGDRLDGGRGKDCVDGGRGRDILTGGQNNDRVIGGTSRDLVNGDGGTDRLHGGSGNDTLNAAFGADRVFAGAGRDRINVATADRRATVRGGRGFDKVRCNRADLRRIKGVERIYVTKRKR